MGRFAHLTENWDALGDFLRVAEEDSYAAGKHDFPATLLLHDHLRAVAHCSAQAFVSFLLPLPKSSGKPGIDDAALLCARFLVLTLVQAAIESTHPRPLSMPFDLNPTGSTALPPLFLVSIREAGLAWGPVRAHLAQVFGHQGLVVFNLRATCITTRKSSVDESVVWRFGGTREVRAKLSALDEVDLWAAREQQVAFRGYKPYALTLLEAEAAGARWVAIEGGGLRMSAYAEAEIRARGGPTLLYFGPIPLLFPPIPTFTATPASPATPPAPAPTRSRTASLYPLLTPPSTPTTPTRTSRLLSLAAPIGRLDAPLVSPPVTPPTYAAQAVTDRRRTQRQIGQTVWSALVQDFALHLHDLTTEKDAQPLSQRLQRP